MSEVMQQCAFNMPMSLARRLDAKVEAERNGAPVGHVNRSSVIRAALTAFLEGTPDPKNVPERTRAASSERREQASMVAYRPKTIAPPRRRKPTASEPSPVRIRTRPAPVAPAE